MLSNRAPFTSSWPVQTEPYYNYQKTSWEKQNSAGIHIFLCIFLFPGPVDHDGTTMTHIYVFTKLASSMKSFCTCNKINAGFMLCFLWISMNPWVYDLQICLLHLYYIKRIEGLTWGDPRPVLLTPVTQMQKQSENLKLMIE